MVLEVTLDHVRCIKQLVASVNKNAKFLLSPLKENLFTAETVLEIREVINSYNKVF